MSKSEDTGVSFYLRKEQREAITVIASQFGTSKSAVVRALVDIGLREIPRSALAKKIEEQENWPRGIIAERMEKHDRG